MTEDRRLPARERLRVPLFRKGNRIYRAFCNAGTSVSKVSEPRGELELVELGRPDSEPRDVPDFNGQWGTCSFPCSKTIVASDVVNGLAARERSSGRPPEVATGEA